MNFSLIDFIVVVTIAAIIGLSMWWPSYECKSKAEKQGMEYDWGIVQGCMVKQEDGRWIDYDRWRILE